MGKKLIILVIIILLILGVSWYLYKNTYYFNKGSDNLNPQTCLKISNDLKIAQCLGEVSSKTRDVSVCTNSPRMYIMTCFRVFAERDGDITKCSEVEPDVDEYNCYTAFADTIRDTSVCDFLSGEKKDYCNKIVATTTKNIYLCEKLITSGYKESCIEIIKSNS